MRLSLFHKYTLLLAGLLAAIANPACAQTEGRDIGPIVVDPTVKTTPVRVSSSTPELHNLANLAFNTHGAYRRVASGQAFDIAFAPAGANQVRVDVTRPGGGSVLSHVANGSSLRNALFRAADAAVKATSGRPGFFASKLAFIGERSGKPEVYTGDLFSGEVRQITRDNALALNPRWSPDGTRIIYTSYFRSGFPDIFVMDLANLQRSNFVSFKGTNSSARYSPNGQQVAMVLSGEGNPEIYVGSAQGRGIRRLTRSPAVEASPCFSPDGNRLVFTSDTAGGPQLYLMATAGGAATRLGTNVSRYCAEPDWSRGDPNKIAFTAAVSRGFQIAVFDVSKREAAKIVSKAPFDAIEPSWLADGRHLVFTARSANQRSLWILDTESGKVTQLTPAAMGPCSQASVLAP